VDAGLRWDTASGEPMSDLLAGAAADPLSAFAGDPGAEVLRACFEREAIPRHACGGAPRRGPIE